MTSILIFIDSAFHINPLTAVHVNSHSKNHV